MFNRFKTTILLPSQTIPLHMPIVNPLTAGNLMALFSTHPPMEERIRRLEAAASRH